MALERKIQSIASQCESGGWSSQGCDEIDLLHSEGPSVYKGAIR
jgi:hypothetical protein